LASTLTDALTAVIQHDPTRPDAEHTFDPEAKRRRHDINTLTAVLSTMHMPSLDQFIEETPRMVRDSILFHWENFRSVVENSLFHVYDPPLRGLIDEIHEAWATALAHSSEYYPTHGGTYVFANVGDLPLNDRQQEHWDAVNEARSRLALALPRFLTYIREEYLEVDIEGGNREAWLKWKQELERDAEFEGTTSFD
jgi:hypothetical protein